MVSFFCVISVIKFNLLSDTNITFNTWSLHLVCKSVRIITYTEKQMGKNNGIVHKSVVGLLKFKSLECQSGKRLFFTSFDPLLTPKFKSNSNKNVRFIIPIKRRIQRYITHLHTSSKILENHCHPGYGGDSCILPATPVPFSRSRVDTQAIVLSVLFFTES